MVDKFAQIRHDKFELGMTIALSRVDYFAITSRILRVSIEHIDSICSLESRLCFTFICSFEIVNIFEVIANKLQNAEP